MRSLTSYINEQGDIPQTLYGVFEKFLAEQGDAIDKAIGPKMEASTSLIFGFLEQAFLDVLASLDVSHSREDLSRKVHISLCSWAYSILNNPETLKLLKFPGRQNLPIDMDAISEVS